MNRHYTADKIKDLVKYINTKFDKAFIGCDIIAGFPDETGEDFEITAGNLKKLDLSRIHVFPYSQRPGTIADKMPNQIDIPEKKRRVSVIQNISDDKLKFFLNKNINTQNEVIIEKNRDKKTGLLKGVTKNYINVLIDADDSFKDTIQNITITGFSTEPEKMLAVII